MDVLDKEGYNVEEAIIEPADDFADRINSINPKHDAPVQEARELGRVDKMILAKLMKECPDVTGQHGRSSPVPPAWEQPQDRPTLLVAAGPLDQ